MEHDPAFPCWADPIGGSLSPIGHHSSPPTTVTGLGPCITLQANAEYICLRMDLDRLLSTPRIMALIIEWGLGLGGFKPRRNRTWRSSLVASP